MTEDFKYRVGVCRSPGRDRRGEFQSIFLIPEEVFCGDHISLTGSMYGSSSGKCEVKGVRSSGGISMIQELIDGKRKFFYGKVLGDYIEGTWEMQEKLDVEKNPIIIGSGTFILMPEKMAIDRIDDTRGTLLNIIDNLKDMREVLK